MSLIRSEDIRPGSPFGRAVAAAEAKGRNGNKAGAVSGPAAATPTPKRRAWSGAKRARGHVWSAGGGGITFPFDSRLEADVFGRLAADLRPGQTLAVKANYDLPALGRREDGACYHRFTPDFSILDMDGSLVRVVEAKGRVARDYKLRRDAFEAEYKVKVEEVTK